MYFYNTDLLTNNKSLSQNSDNYEPIKINLKKDFFITIVLIRVAFLVKLIVYNLNSALAAWLFIT